MDRKTRERGMGFATYPSRGKSGDQIRTGGVLNGKTISTTAIVIAFVLVLSASAGASRQAAQAVTQVNLAAGMSPKQEVPAPSAAASAATGAFTGTATATGNGADFTWKLVFAQLTGPATAAHLHIAAKGEPGP